jgi:hypothetical protein
MAKAKLLKSRAEEMPKAELSDSPTLKPESSITMQQSIILKQQ